MTTRRDFLIALGACASATSLPVRAEAGHVARVGFLGNSTAALEANLIEPFRTGLRELGYVEGRNLVIEYRWAEGSYARFPMLVAELAALRVDMIVTAGTPASLAVSVRRPTSPSSWSRSAIPWAPGSSRASPDREVISPAWRRFHRTSKASGSSC